MSFPEDTDDLGGSADNGEEISAYNELRETRDEDVFSPPQSVVFPGYINTSYPEGNFDEFH